MTQGERVKTVRKSKEMTMEEFGKRLGVTRTAISNIEKGYRGLTEQMLKSICREFSVDEEWLRTGDGDMPQKLSEEEEVAALVSDLLEDGRENPFFGIILEIVQTYNCLLYTYIARFDTDPAAFHPRFLLPVGSTFTCPNRTHFLLSLPLFWIGLLLLSP